MITFKFFLKAFRHKGILYLLLVFSAAFSQSKNPDISAITDFRAFTHNDQTIPQEKGQLNLSLEEVEVAVQGYLNPYARADIFLSKPGAAGEVEIEEASATFLRGLPWELNVKIGKYLVDFGKLNTLHPHAYYFIDRPLIQQLYLGEDGFKDTGINMSFLLPTGSLYSQVSFNVVKGDFVAELSPANTEQASAASGDLTGSADSKQPLAYSGRLSTHAQLSDYANLELGLSSLAAKYDPINDLQFLLIGFDYKYKWRPSRYTSLTLQGEALLNKRKVIAGESEEEGMKQNITTGGFFSYLNLQFRQRWNLGLEGEWSQAPDNENDDYWAASIFGGFSPMEETSVIRLLLKRQQRPHETAFNAAVAQVIFSLGPHKAHQF